MEGRSYTVHLAVSYQKKATAPTTAPAGPHTSHNTVLPAGVSGRQLANNWRVHPWHEAAYPPSTLAAPTPAQLTSQALQLQG